MTSFGFHNKCLPFTSQFVRLARRKGKRRNSGSREPLHAEDIEWADSDTILLPIAAVAVNDRQGRTRLRLALAGAKLHKKLDAYGYTELE